VVIVISRQPVHETPAENNESFTGAFECRVLNGETVGEKMLRKIVFLLKLISDVDGNCKSTMRKKAFVFDQHVYTNVM